MGILIVLTDEQLTQAAKRSTLLVAGDEWNYIDEEGYNDEGGWYRADLIYQTSTGDHYMIPMAWEKEADYDGRERLDLKASEHVAFECERVPETVCRWLRKK